jgi:hypothetical protein
MPVSVGRRGWWALVLVVGCSSGESSGDGGRDGGGEGGVEVAWDAGGADLDGWAAGSGGDGPGEGGDADVPPAFVMEWSLGRVGAGGPVGCEEAGTPMVRLALRHLVSSMVVTERFPCAAGAGVISTLPTGDYEVTAALEDQQRRAVSQFVSGPYTVRPGPPSRQRIEFQIQSFEIDWVLVRGSAALTCAAAGAEVVQLTAQLGSESPETFRFPCQAATGETTAIRLGQYNLRLQLRSGTDSVLSETAAMPLRVAESERAAVSVVFEVR